MFIITFLLACFAAKHQVSNNKLGPTRYILCSSANLVQKKKRKHTEYQKEIFYAGIPLTFEDTTKSIQRNKKKTDRL